MIRTVIADDEGPARDKLRLWLDAEPDIDIIGEYADGLGTAQGLLEQTVDLLFLDIQMPGLSGLELAAQLDPSTAPLLVFVTAYDRHALAAFDLDAVDYLLKPYDAERFQRALGRVKDRLRAADTSVVEIQSARLQTRASERLLVPVAEGLKLIDCAAIHSLEADDNYVHLYTKDQHILLRRTLKDLLQQLGGRFARIHKSAAVNISEIEAFEALFKGDYDLRLRSGKRLRLSRRFAPALFDRVGGSPRR